MSLQSAEEIACDGLSMHPFDIDEIQFTGKRLKEIINKARIDTIKECAKVASLKSEWIHSPIDYEGYWESDIDKQSILKLIEQVK